MNRVTCTCKPSELLACAYCRTEYYRTLKLAMMSPNEPLRFQLTVPRGPYQTQYMQYGKIVKKLEAA
jgi:hypothetical protein